jgi:hypothetical protein
MGDDSEPGSLTEVIRRLCIRVDSSYKLSVLDNKKSKETGKTDRIKVSLTAAIPNPCSMDELACAIPRSRYDAVGMSRQNVKTLPTLVVSSPDPTVVTADATSMSAPSVYVPPFSEDIKSTGLIEVKFTNVSVYAGDLHQSPPGVLFSKSAQYLVSNTVSRMRWLRLHSIDDASLLSEGEHTIVARSICYEHGIRALLQKTVSPEEAQTDKQLLPNHMTLRGVSHERIVRMKGYAYATLGKSERKLYLRPNDPDAPGDSTLQKQSVIACLDTWTRAYDGSGKDSGVIQGFFPFRPTYETQFTATGRHRGQTRAARRMADQATMAGQAPPPDVYADGEQTEALVAESKRVLKNYSFYVAVRQSEQTESKHRQLYRIQLKVNDDLKFELSYDDKERFAEYGRAAKDRIDITRLKAALKRIPDRNTIPGASDIAVRTPAVMTLRIMLSEDKHADAVSAYTQFSKLMAQSSQLSSLPYLKHMETLGLLRPCVKLAYCIRELQRVMGTNGSIEALKREKAAATTADIYAWDKVSRDFLQRVEENESHLSMKAYIALLENQNSDETHAEWHTTTDADNWGVDISVNVSSLRDRADEQLPPDFAAISPLDQNQLKLVIYRAVCRMTCTMSGSENNKLLRTGGDYGIGVGE